MKKVLILLTVGILIIGWIAFCGYQWSWGPFVRLHDIKTSGLPGNASQYDLSYVQRLETSPLNGKRILFLGSSVTYGAASQGISFADYLSARDGCVIQKEAVSGTTLSDNGINSYVSRLKKLDTKTTFDLFVCQLSTNDATQKKPLGRVDESAEITRFDTSTVAGALEYILSYVRETWDCPVVFYTNPCYDSMEYAAMVQLLHILQEKWGFSVMDMWSDGDFNEISADQKALYMADTIHPTKAGYLEWWTPYMEEKLKEVMKNG